MPRIITIVVVVAAMITDRIIVETVEVQPIFVETGMTIKCG